MIKLTKTINDPNGIVSKLIFEGDGAIAESVVYNYGGRGVICFSVQSGCPVGCVFCGTGNRFIRGLYAAEMLEQINVGLELLKGVDKIQIMSMSMGEPMLNWERVEAVARECLENDYYFFVSTVGIHDADISYKFFMLGEKYSKFGLQFSLHKANDEDRFNLFRNKELEYMNIANLSFVGSQFYAWTGNLPYYNYIVTNDSDKDINNIVRYFGGYHITCSVMCDTKELTKGDVEPAQIFANKLLERGVREVSVFDPAGQDTIGGGCGQLLYVQGRLKEISNV